MVLWDWNDNDKPMVQVKKVEEKLEGRKMGEVRPIKDTHYLDYNDNLNHEALRA